ncbi:MAG: immunity 26/phosphotriesterase HocA family protein [Carboxylicivirga sp.]|jgi:hypothetical protein|nr:immunity 26/phosphotriesterase HocA family protein [Carboxylicivirga sp.]
MLELDNHQRKYLGLEPVLNTWEKIILKGDTYRPDSIIYYENDTIKKQVISTAIEYKEIQYNELIENREFVLPKTKRGKSKKLTASVLESKTPIGVYLNINTTGDFVIGNHTSQTTFYSRQWFTERVELEIETEIINFIEDAPENHLLEIEKFRQAKRKSIKYKAGDFFVYKLNRTEYGFGRILFDINKARKKKLLPENHGLNMLMGPALLIKQYAYKSSSKDVDIEFLKSQKSLPSDYIMDNVIFYGEYEIFGHQPLTLEEFEFPISYGQRIDQVPNVFLQWGLIHKELPKSEFKKYLNIENGGLGSHNPYGYYSIGFRPSVETIELNLAIQNNGELDYNYGDNYRLEWDLRNPKHCMIKEEIFKKFNLVPEMNYADTSEKEGAESIIDIIEKMK